jgi:hypothetical protein
MAASGVRVRVRATAAVLGRAVLGTGRFGQDVLGVAVVLGGFVLGVVVCARFIPGVVVVGGFVVGVAVCARFILGVVVGGFFLGVVAILRTGRFGVGSSHW